MDRSCYSNSIEGFCRTDPDQLLGELTRRHGFELTEQQRDAWRGQVPILKNALGERAGFLHLEFAIPRMGSRADAVVLLGSVIFVLEFKIGQEKYLAADIDQVVDYALDLQNFHEGSHSAFLAPILIATQAPARPGFVLAKENLLAPVLTDATGLRGVLDRVLEMAPPNPIDAQAWSRSRYRPTPTIIEAARVLYRDHSVEEISHQEAGATNLTSTSATIESIIESSRREKRKSICFVTGVPGAGKTLVGLNIATTHRKERDEAGSVYLSGNDPLVKVLREALARDHISRERSAGRKVRKGDALRPVKKFIQNVHHFRDDCLADAGPPYEHIAIFDEAQRAWEREKTMSFMRRKKGIENFSHSEPEFLISCLERHPDWAVVICLVGGGQEINTGEAGIGEWIDALKHSFANWRIFASDRLTDSEYGAGRILESLRGDPRSHFAPELHLATSIRSFRSEKVSRFVKQVLDLEATEARNSLAELAGKYPIALTRDLGAGRRWVKQQAHGSERYGILVSSQAERLKPYAVDVKSPVDPVHWSLDGKDDVRSSYYLEDVATEFQVQGLELDWACVAWDGDFRYSDRGWQHWSFRGNRWQRIRQERSRAYQKNAYRVLLTRARQGMVIVVPDGDQEDPTRDRGYYDDTFEYLKSIGLSVIA